MGIAAVCGGVVVGMTNKLGERKAFWNCNYYLFSINLLFFAVPFHWFFLFGTYWLFMLFSPGYDALQNTMVTKFIGEHVSKFYALRQLCGYCVQGIAEPLYAFLFDAKAVSYFSMNRPWLLSLAMRALEFVTWFAPAWGCYKFLGSTFDAMEEERKPKAAEDKKTD